jgi:hypothetical protein
MWLLVFLVGAALAFNGYMVGMRPETVVHQIYAAAYLIGGVLTMALSVVIFALAGLRGDMKRLTAATRDASSRQVDARPAAEQSASSAPSMASGGIDRDALGAMQSRWSGDNTALAPRAAGLGDQARIMIGVGLAIAVAIGWFYG